MRRLIIAIDFDDVLVESSQVLPELLNDKYGTRFQLGDLYQTNYEAFGVKTKAEAMKRVHSVMESELYRSIAPSANTVNIVQTLAKHHELHVVTGRGSFLEPITIETINHHFPGCFKTIQFTNYFSDEAQKSKGDICRELQADILIDDLPHHLDSVLKAGVREVILFGEYPWSESSRASTGVVRCGSWAAVKSEVDRIAGK